METQPSLERQELEEVIEEEDEDVDAENIQENENMPQPYLRISSQVKNPPTRYDDYVSAVALVSIHGDPSCFQEAIKVSESIQWKKYMNKEMDALEE